METTTTGWWHRHGWTLAILLSAFGVAFAIRTIWTYPVIAQWGPLYTYAGGSDSYYHSRVMQYIILNHTNLIHDPMLKYPIGAINPREPLFDWMNAILGLVFAPFFGGNAVVAGSWFLDLQGPLWAALGVFPVYLIGREVSGRRMGLIAALIFPFLSANIDSSIFGYANYLSFYTFLILVTVYSYIRTVKAVGSRRWIESYRDPKQYLPGLRNFLRTERNAVKWAVFTGVSLGALALAWQGYTYAVVVIGFTVLISMVAERVRRVDSFGLYVVTWIVGLVGFPMAVPYYLVQHQFAVWFDLPLLLYFGVLALLLPFLLLRDVPWVVSIPMLIGLFGLAALGLAVVNPTYFTSVVTGQGYFVKNLIYSTVAEAQAPSVDELVIGYGVVTFFLAFAGVAICLYLLVHNRFKRYMVVFLVFSILSIYLPISAAKFFLLGSPAFALLPAEAIRRALDVGGYPELRRTVASLSDRRSQFAAFRRAFKVRHVAILALVVMLIVPNIWISIDAGIPGNTKDQFATQVADTVPSWLSLNKSAPASNIFGAAGVSLDTPNQYDSAGYNWLATQDTNIPEASRPAFISWWDYGFQAIDQGQHPSVADNFQNGIDPAGQFLLAQNESLAISVLATTLLQAEQRDTGLAYLPASLNTILAGDGLNLTTLHNLLVNESYDYNVVVAHPERYLPVDPSTLTLDNAMYLAVEYYIASALPLSGVAQVYDNIQAYTGWTIRYAMADTRVFPFSGTDTGIYYAPAELTGRVIDSAGLPDTFFNVTVLGSDGNTYPADAVPPGITPVQYNINYFAPFYNSMIYRTYIGYNGTDIGLSGGIPGLEGAAADEPIEPGWMLQHFMVVYQTAYVCPGQKNAPSGAACFVAANTPAAKRIANQTNGTVDTSAISYFEGGESMLAYYPGEPMIGVVSLPNGRPVSGVRLTVYDQWGIPHQTVVTGSDGSYSLVLPPGNDTVNVTEGTFSGLDQAGAIVLDSLKIYVPNAIGYSLDAQNLYQAIHLGASTLEGTVFWNVANNTTFNPEVDPVAAGAQVVFWGANLSKLTAVVDPSGTFQIQNVPPGVYEYSVLAGGHNYTQSSVTVEAGQVVNASAPLTPGSVSGVVTGPAAEVIPGATVVLTNASGLVGSATTNANGNFTIGSLAPGNYSLSATLAGTPYRSAAVPVAIATEGATVQANLTVVASSPVSVTVELNGVPAANLPVRFTPAPSFVNASLSPLDALKDAASNGTVAMTSSAGVASVALPYGNYSVYVLGYLGSKLYSGLATVTAPATLASGAPVISLAPAVTLTGSVAALPSANSTAVVAYAATGGSTLAWVGGNGSYVLRLPAGSYSLLALQGTTGKTQPIYSAIGSVTLVGPTTVNLRPTSAIAARFVVGTTLPDGAFYAAANASVTISAGPSGPSVPIAVAANGSAAAYVPASLPISAPSYCVAASAPGYQTTRECGLTPNGLADLNDFSLPLSNVAVTLRVEGLPAGQPITVNFTAESPTAVDRNLTGGPTFSLSLPPGEYGVGAEAKIGNGTTVYLPPTLLSTEIPFGATISQLTLVVIAQINSTGTLSVPSGISTGNVTVALSSPVMNITVNGTAYTKGFHVAPGSYTAHVQASSGATTYVNLTRVTVSSSGAITPKLVLNRVGVTLSGTVTSRTGTPLSLNATVTLRSTTGVTLQTSVTSGSFSTVVAPNATYRAFANATVSTSGPNGSYFVTWSSTPQATCTVTSISSQCTVPMQATEQPVWLNGTLSSPGVPGLVNGTVRLVGPYPYANVTFVNTTTGAFTAQVLPGAYSVYASGGGGSEPLATFASALALPSTQGSNLSLSLAPTWIDTISITGPNATVGHAGFANLTVSNVFGDRALYPLVTPGTSVRIALPVGTYVVSAVAPGSLNGVPGNATARATVAIVSGNVGTVLALNVTVVRSVAANLVGPTSALVNAGGTASFAFSVRNSGNVPITVHPVGSPSYWSFNFTMGNVTLSPGGAAAAGEAVITVPGGTPVDHPAVAIEFALANGTIVGKTSIAPTVNVVGYYGVAVGKSTAAVEIGPATAVLPFYLVDTGNAKETVLLTVVDQNRIVADGWTVLFTGQSAGASYKVSLSAGQNSTQHLNLTATSAIFIPPLSATVMATVVNASGAASASVTLSVPTGYVKVSTANSTALVITGPSIGPGPSALPDWVIPLLSFVPAIALVGAVLTYRWWRTRRWTRR